MTSKPNIIDSRRWTGDLPPNEPRPVATIAPSRAKLLLALIFISLLIPLGWATLWGLSGSPMVISTGPNLLSVEFGLCAGLATVIIMRRRAWADRLMIAILAFGTIAFAAHASGYFQDLASARYDHRVRLFVEAARLPCFGRGCPMLPEVTVSGEGRVRKMNAPSRFAGSLVPGDSCLEASVAHGRHGFEFVKALVRSSGDGTGSYMVADQNRERCLGSGRLQ